MGPGPFIEARALGALSWVARALLSSSVAGLITPGEHFLNGCGVSGKCNRHLQTLRWDVAHTGLDVVGNPPAPRFSVDPQIKQTWLHKGNMVAQREQ